MLLSNLPMPSYKSCCTLTDNSNVEEVVGVLRPGASPCFAIHIGIINATSSINCPARYQFHTTQQVSLSPLGKALHLPSPVNNFATPHDTRNNVVYKALSHSVYVVVWRSRTRKGRLPDCSQQEKECLTSRMVESVVIPLILLIFLLSALSAVCVMADGLRTSEHFSRTVVRNVTYY